MKIQVFSDLHMDGFALRVDEITDQGADVVVFAGDACNGGYVSKALKWFAETFPNKPKVYVPGNHEFYGKFMQDMQIQMSEQCEALGIKGIIYPGDKFIIGGKLFIGGTLWTDFELETEGLVDMRLNCRLAEKYMMDYRLIHDANRREFMNSQITADFTRDLFQLYMKKMEETLSKNVDKNDVVVVTHHAPSKKSIHPKYTGELLNAAFVSDLQHFIEGWSDIRLWIHGHTHSNMDYRINSTRVVCNPRGYIGENSEFDGNMVIEI